MTLKPKAKALEIANSMYNGSVFDKTKTEHLLELENAKRCAVNAVKLLIEAYRNVLQYDDNTFLIIDIDYYTNVILEIEKLTD
jgi:hypothetical protein